MLVAGLEVSPAQTGPMTRKGAAQTAVSNNLDLLARAFAPRAARQETSVVQRPFVPVLILNPAVRRARPADETQSSVDYTARVGWATPTGTSVTVSAGGSKPVEGKPASSGNLRLAVTQALLRGGPAGAHYPIEQARMNLRIEKARFKKALEDLLLKVERAYWELSFAQAEAQIKKRSEDQARKQYETTKENIRRGLLAAGEIHVVNENLVSFQQQSLRAQENLVIAQRNLAQLLNLPLGSPLQAGENLDGENQALPRELSPENHPDYRIAVLELEREKYTLEFQRDQSAPRLNLDASVGMIGGLETPWADIAGAEHPEGRVGLFFEMPLIYAPDAARIQKARLNHEGKASVLRATRQRLTARAGNLRVQGEGQLKRLALSNRLVELARSKLENEKEKYRNGVSTLDDIVRFQQNLDRALIGAKRAVVELRVRRAQLYKVQGRLHEDLGVSIE